MGQTICFSSQECAVTLSVSKVTVDLVVTIDVGHVVPQSICTRLDSHSLSVTCCNQEYGTTDTFSTSGRYVLSMRGLVQIGKNNSQAFTADDTKQRVIPLKSISFC